VLTLSVALKNPIFFFRRNCLFFQFALSAKPWNTVPPLENQELKIALPPVT